MLFKLKIMNFLLRLCPKNNPSPSYLFFYFLIIILKINFYIFYPSLF
jgi:hypothetical protein